MVRLGLYVLGRLTLASRHHNVVSTCCNPWMQHTVRQRNTHLSPCDLGVRESGLGIDATENTRSRSWYRTFWPCLERDVSSVRTSPLNWDLGSSDPGGKRQRRSCLPHFPPAWRGNLVQHRDGMQPGSNLGNSSHQVSPSLMCVQAIIAAFVHICGPNPRSIY